MSSVAELPSLVAELGRTILSAREQGLAVEFPVTHSFAPGFYIRTVTVPADMYVVTKQHHTEHPYIVTKGRILVWTEHGGKVELVAPCCGITKPGTIRLARTLEETVWTTFHPTHETDIEVLERELATDPAELLLDFEKLKGLTT